MARARDTMHSEVVSVATHAAAVPAPAFAQVFSEHVQYVARALRHFGVASRDLEDECQEVFLVALRKLADFEGRASVRTWLYRIAWKTAANYRRRARPPESLACEPAVAADQERELGHARALDRLAEILGALDDDRRAVFVLYEIEELSMREVCEVVGCPLQTGYSRLKIARERVAAALREGAASEEERE
jgi:RNA polymerase sigma-70 factor (ECF subfamily)